jgi:hypothetical protein
VDTVIAVTEGAVGTDLKDNAVLLDHGGIGQQTALAIQFRTYKDILAAD